MCEGPRRSWRFLLVDDDPIFGTVMTTVAASLGFDVAHIDVVGDVLRERDARGCDVLIVDYDLGELSGLELAERLSHDLEGAPVILISGTARSPGSDKGWPPCIVGFALKGEGVPRILDLAVAASCRAGGAQLDVSTRDTQVRAPVARRRSAPV